LKELLTQTFGYILPTKSLKENIGINRTVPVVLEGIVQRADYKNGNGRIYPRRTLEREITKLQQVIKDVGYILCHFDHSDDLEIKLALSCAKIVKLWWNGNDVYAKIELLDESNIQAAQARSFIKSGIKLGISSRGEGSLKQEGGNQIVQDDLNLATWDLVSIPSTQGAFLNVMRESLGSDVNEDIILENTSTNNIDKKNKLKRIFENIKSCN
jgi:hypothetical protein